MTFKLPLLSLFVLPLLVACGEGASGVSGEYGTEIRGTWTPILTIKKDTAAITSPDGTRMNGRVEAANGQQVVLRFDDGQTFILPVLDKNCLDAAVDEGLMLGKLCKR